ncbi:MAG: hypothetical protein EXR09_06435 [Acetobacteraceae bacterium]|nr:hypothetical protein [Acetobacteraceae bacterium]
MPSLLTMLDAVQLPPAGGETQFVNRMMGYASLPDVTKSRIADLRAIHSGKPAVSIAAVVSPPRNKSANAPGRSPGRPHPS